MSAHVLLILLNKLEKRDRMRGLPSILSVRLEPVATQSQGQHSTTEPLRSHLSYDITITLKSHCTLQTVKTQMKCHINHFSLADCFFFQNQLFFEKFFQEYHQSVKQFGYRSGPTFCWA